MNYKPFETLITTPTFVLARILLQSDMGWLRYPKFGVYCYLLVTDEGIHILDPGPKYSLIRKRDTDNLALLTKTLQKKFPNKPILSILLTHWHYDHSENAPDLQLWAEKTYGICPPIRIHTQDQGPQKFLHLFSRSLQSVFRKASPNITPHMGEPLIDGEEIAGTSFIIRHAPGHTKGFCVLISEKFKSCIIGWMFQAPKNPLIRWFTEDWIDEDVHSRNGTLEKFTKYKKVYTQYFLHPRA